MKITLANLETAAYAIRKRLQGYRLLKNPKGTSPDEVNMIKHSFGIIYKDSAEMYSYSKIQRQKVDGKTVLNEKILYATYYINPKTKQRTNQKSVLYFANQNGLWTASGEKTIPQEEQRQRLAEIKRVHKKIGYNDDRELAYEKERYEKERKNSFYQPPVSLLANIMTFGLAKFLRADSRPYAPTFFKTLRANLKNH